MTWDWVQAAHAIPGRTRLRTPVLRTSRELVEQVAETLAAVPGVHEVRARPYTGSILVEHDPEISHRAVLEAARRAQGVERSIDMGGGAPRSNQKTQHIPYRPHVV
ncbi:MAG: HMA2 domain-containing protein, partial [Kofleriaceae bacterium]